MSIFRDFFVKEKPFFTGIARGFGFGGGGGGGAPDAPTAPFSVSGGTKITSGGQPMQFASGAGTIEYYIAFQTLTFLDAPGGNTTYSLAFKQNNGSNAAGVRIHGTQFQTVIMLEEFSA